jgi:DNA polymerase elongation subunit (family B)
MLRYGLCSSKDSDGAFLGVLAWMRAERLKLKELSKKGDKAAKSMDTSLKVLINGSYGFLGTAGYSYNDYEAAALVTAYGRKILALMSDCITELGGTPINLDTDGIHFSHADPQGVAAEISRRLPSGIEIELEMVNCAMYAHRAKNYVILHPDGELTLKGLFRKRNVMPLERHFQIELVTRRLRGEDWQAYYLETRDRILSCEMPVSELSITKKISKSDKTLTGLGLGNHGDKVTYWYTKICRYHKTTGKPLSPARLETTTEDYWPEYYADLLDDIVENLA